MKISRKIILSFGIILAIALIGTIAYLLVSKSTQKDNSVYEKKEIIEKKLNEIQADAIISKTYMGGECNEYVEYHICYNSNKIYKYEEFRYYALTDNINGGGSSPTYKLFEYDVKKKKINELKKFIEKEIENENTNRNTSEDYMLKYNGKEYYILDFTTISQLLDDIG